MLKDKYYFLNNDLVFKHIFGSNSNKRFIQRFLELYLNLPLGSLSDLIILNSVKLTPSNIRTRKFEIDILIYIPSLNMKFLLEMQNKFNEDAFIKGLVYLCNLVVKEYKVGEKSFIDTNTIKGLMLTRSASKEYKRVEDLYLVMGEEKHIKMAKKLLNYKIINIANYKSICYNKYIKELSMWYMLINADTLKELNNIWKLSENFPLIREAIEEMRKLNGVLYGQDYWIDEVFYNTKLARSEEKGFNDGKAVGFNDGINERNYEIAKKMIQENEPIDKIKLFTDLPIKEINKLVKTIK